MTSSLVGSEMCIRDSICDMRMHAPVTVWREQVPGGCGPWWCGGGARGVAVSYTHLTLPTICSV
eukprot:11959604-Prorocentrum_lima.AAC.1